MEVIKSKIFYSLCLIETYSFPTFPSKTPSCGVWTNTLPPTVQQTKFGLSPSTIPKDRYKEKSKGECVFTDCKDG